jgi:hypothetical protein
MQKRSAKYWEEGRIGLSALLIVSLLLTFGGVFQSFFINRTEAAALSQVQAILSSSAPAASSSMTIKFVTPTGISGTADKTLTIELDTTGTLFSLPANYSFNDVDVATSSSATCSSATFTDISLSGSATTTSQWSASFNTSTDLLTLTYPGGGNSSATVGANTCMSIEIGAVATASTTGTNFNTPTKVLAAGVADVYTIAMAGTVTDSGNAMVAIIEGVTVSATVTESLSFTTTGVTTGSCTGDSGSPTVRDTSASSTTIPFGSLSTANAFFVGCHRLSVSTNASSGFATSIEENKPLHTTGSTTISDTTCDSACSHVATSTWATATNNGFGYSCENISGNGMCNSSSSLPLGGVTSYRNIACTGGAGADNCNAAVEASQVFMSTSSPVSAQDVRVHYKISISGTQPAGVYSNTVTYIATPVF